jgi:hypothetical protein
VAKDAIHIPSRCAGTALHPAKSFARLMEQADTAIDQWIAARL